MRTSLTLVTPLFFFLASAQSTVISWDDPMDCGMEGMGYLRPRIALNEALDPVVIWGRTSPASNYAAVGGVSSFSAPVMVHPDGVTTAVADWQGSEIASDGNTVWVVLKATPEMDMPMYIVRSDDGGFTWGDTLRITASEGPWSRFPNVAAGPMGEPIVQYMAFEPNFLDPHYAVSHMMGGTFMPPVNVSSPFASGEVCDCCPSGITARGTDVVSLYRNNGSNVRTIWAATSDDGGASFDSGGEVDPTGWTINSCPSSGPDAYITGDSVRFVWMSGAVDNAKVYVGSAHLPELNTGVGARITAAAPNFLENYPRIAGNGDTLGVVWQQGVSGAYEILFSWSVTGIAGLSEPDTVNTSFSGAQKTPDIAYANGAFHIVWSDVPAGLIRYRKATLSSNVSIEERPEDALRPWPVPASSVLHVPGARSWSFARLIDAVGRPVRTLNNSGTMDVSMLPDGAYRLVGQRPDGTAVNVPVVVVH
jgi:hypothetical protein